MNSENYVKASEIQEYTYCKRAWWLRMHGRLSVTEQMKAGTIAHEEMAKSVQGFNKKRIALTLIVGIGGLLLLIYTLVQLLL